MDNSIRILIKSCQCSIRLVARHFTITKGISSPLLMIQDIDHVLYKHERVNLCTTNLSTGHSLNNMYKANNRYI